MFICDIIYPYQLKQKKTMKEPKWTVLYNITNDPWIGTGWEFFDDEVSAKACYARQRKTGNCPTMRPYHRNDRVHLGAVHIEQRTRV